MRFLSSIFFFFQVEFLSSLSKSEPKQLTLSLSLFFLFLSFFLLKNKNKNSGVANLHVETAADASKGGHGGAAKTGRGLTMLHRVVPGPCDESFGLACARAARLPDEVVEAAAAKAAELEAAGVGKKRRVGGGAFEAEGGDSVTRARRFLADFAALSGDSEAEVTAKARELVDGLRAEGGGAAAALRGLLA